MKIVIFTLIYIYIHQSKANFVTRAFNKLDFAAINFFFIKIAQDQYQLFLLGTKIIFVRVVFEVVKNGHYFGWR